ncbi:hypothetical protein [Brevundimonas faecalis]|uniref:Uncharacterized protein n=1 Tax=Brevundimonas faecalis TaxID=947378 RepID=A0ABV2RAW3_9CAUL
MLKPLTDRQRTMIAASEPSDRDRTVGAGVELQSGADYAVARSLERRELGDVEGPGGSFSGLYFNNAEGLAVRNEILGTAVDQDEPEEGGE